MYLFLFKFKMSASYFLFVLRILVLHTTRISACLGMNYMYSATIFQKGSNLVEEGGVIWLLFRNNKNVLFKNMGNYCWLVAVL